MNLNALESVDELYYFYLVVKYAGFGAASEATNISKSKLSRYVLELEKKFNVQLIIRSTRQFKVTELGQELYQECCKMMFTVNNAASLLTHKLQEPEGTIRISCPPIISDSPIRQLFSTFLKKYPKVNLAVSLTNQKLDLYHDKIDIIIRNDFDSLTRHDCIVHDLTFTPHVLVAHPNLPEINHIQIPQDLAKFPCIHFGSQNPYYSWRLKKNYSDEVCIVNIRPRVITNDLSAVYYATFDQIGIAEMPLKLIKKDIQQGRLKHILPDWQTNESRLKIAYSYHHNDRFIIDKLVEHLMEGYKGLNQEVMT